MSSNSSNMANTDTARYLDEPSAGRLTIQYAPVIENQLSENPPRFTWLPVVDEDARYVLRLSRSDQFVDADTQLFSDIALNFFTPAAPLEPGIWFWSYAEWCAETKKPLSGWSVIRSFELAEDLPTTPLASRQQRFSRTVQSHPRLWLDSESLSEFQQAVGKDSNHCAWSHFHQHSINPWIDRAVMKEPEPYPNDERTAPVWRQTYIECQELMYAIRHLAVGGKVLKDQNLVDKAKLWLLEAASWDPAGTTSRSYTDEWAFRVTLALAWGYDWLYDDLTPEERETVRAALLIRTREVADHVIHQANIHLFPFDSHAVRSVSAVLIPACIAMLHEEDEAEQWLNYSIEFLYTVYSPWGDAQGGWAEGPHYWMTGMAYLIDAANLLKNYTSLDLYQRPFFQKTADFPLYTKAPDTRRGTFGDD